VLFPSIYNIEPYLLWSALFHTFFVQAAIVCFFHLYIILNPIYHGVLFSYFLCSKCYCVLFPSIYILNPIYHGVLFSYFLCSNWYCAVLHLHITDFLLLQNALSWSSYYCALSICILQYWLLSITDIVIFIEW